MRDQPMCNDLEGAGHGSGDYAALLPLLHAMEALKHLPRTGWVDREVEAPESVAAHSWRLAMMAWLIADMQGLDGARAMRIAMVHDLPEVLTGDSTPFDEYADTPEERRRLASSPPEHGGWRNTATRAAKHARERAALEKMLIGVPELAATAVRAAWEDYDAGDSPEARLVGQLDTLEAYLQGLEYANDDRLGDARTLESFRVDSELRITLPEVRELLEALVSGPRFHRQMRESGARGQSPGTAEEPTA